MTDLVIENATLKRRIDLLTKNLSAYKDIADEATKCRDTINTLRTENAKLQALVSSQESIIADHRKATDSVRGKATVSSDLADNPSARQELASLQDRYNRLERDHNVLLEAYEDLQKQCDALREILSEQPSLRFHNEAISLKSSMTNTLDGPQATESVSFSVTRPVDQGEDSCNSMKPVVSLSVIDTDLPTLDPYVPFSSHAEPGSVEHLVDISTGESPKHNPPCSLEPTMSSSSPRKKY